MLITGDSGLLGANLAFLWRDAYAITGISRGKIRIQGTDHISVDLTDFEKTADAVADVDPEIIVHTAAMANVDECERCPEKSRLVNTETTEMLVRAAAKRGARFIYISTDSFYQNNDGSLCDERHPVTPGNVYAESKLAGESPVLAYENGLVLRTNFYGYNLQPKMSLGEWILDGLRSGKQLNMFTDVRFSPILVNDLADVTQTAADKGLTGLFNAGGSEGISKYDFAIKIRETFDIQTGIIAPCSVRDFPFEARRSTDMAMDSSKLEKAAGVKMPAVLDGIRRFKRLEDVKYKEKIGASAETVNIE
jgi:dTDP-4-dehydrorhamnose reductase